MSTKRTGAWTVSMVSLLALAALAACGETTTSPVESVDGVSAPRFALSPGQASVVVGLEPGADFFTYLANNSGRLASEFWDNNSADNLPGNLNCNVGHYANGIMSAGCANQSAGSMANMPAPGIYTQYLGDNTPPSNKDATAFMLSGATKYNVKTLGAFHGYNSDQVGYFTKTAAGVYTFYPVPEWQTVGAPYVVNTFGLAWGFYISNTFNPASGGCNSPNTDCSDATGGWQSTQYQQFALFSNPTGTKYLVGIEDNRLGLVETAHPEDSDYQDYILSVEPIAKTVGTRGCSPGYWKNHTFPTNGTFGYTKTQLFAGTTYDGSPLFSNAYSGMTLQSVLANGGGGMTALGRQTVSAFFNAVVYSDFKYSPDEVISKFNAAAGGTAAQQNALKDEFESLTDVNGRTCTNPTGK